MMSSARHLVVLAAFAALALTWAGLRTALHDQLVTSAARDLHTIADLVATELRQMAERHPDRRGAALAALATAPESPLAATLRRASDERYRSVRFFERDGQADTRLVEAARAARRDGGEGDDGGNRGLIAAPYPDREGEPVVGVWRWLPALDLGISVERPHARLAQPLVWFDWLFAGLLGLLALTAAILGLPRPGAIAAAFCRPDIRRCGPYLIERQIGEGAMSIVYLARHQHLGRAVALKRLKLQAATDEISARFDREARLASRLAHPAIVTVLDHGRAPDGGFYYAMEFVPGLTLSDWVRDHGPLHPARALRILRQIAEAVAAMHRAGLLHRDIKPDNIMVHAAHDDYDLVKLLDFGLIKDLENTGTRDLTRGVRVLGTPAFMAPERLSDPRNVDPRTDLYGIGAVGFFLLTGRKPFEAEREGDLAQQILHIPAPPVSSLSPFHIPERLDALVTSLLAKNPDWRPADADALAAELRELERLHPWRRELARLWWQSVFALRAEDRRATPTRA